MPKVDFIIRTFNEEVWLPKVLKSIYSQTLNQAISVSTAKYQCILSAHSLPYSKKWLKNAITAIEKGSNIAAITGHYTSLSDAPKFEFLKGYFSSFMWRRKDFYKYMTNTNSLIRKDLWSVNITLMKI
jgi:hypothetical protein